MFHPDATAAALTALELQAAVPDSGPVADYCRFYGLDVERRLPNVQHACGWLQAAGQRVLVHVFRPLQPKGTVWVVHGYLEHSGLYPSKLPLLLQEGFAVVIYDQPGHGLSPGIRAGIDSFHTYQQVLNALLLHLQPQLPVPSLALGQSMGGGILMDHVLSRLASDQQPAFCRAFLLAPLLLPARVQWWQIDMGYWLVSAWRSSMPRLFRRNTSDEHFLRFMREEDPLQAQWLPMGWIRALKDWVVHMRQQPRSRFPVWVVQGGQDQTVNNAYNLGYIRRHFRVRAYLLLQQASHQLANERADIRQAQDQLLRQFLHEHDDN